MSNVPNLNTSLVLLLVLMVGSVAIAVDYNSVSDGAWADENTWMPVGVPNDVVQDTATVHHTVSVGMGDTEVRRITIMPGAVLRDAETLRGMLTEITCVELTNDGVIMKGPGDQWGGVLHITASTLTNNGAIVGGGGTEAGGWLRIEGGDIDNNGDITGGDGFKMGGLVDLNGSGTMTNTGRIAGGSAHQSMGGRASVNFTTVINDAGGVIEGGRNYPIYAEMGFQGGYGGDVFVMGGTIEHRAGALITGGESHIGGLAFVLGENKTIEGVVTHGTNHLNPWESIAGPQVIIDPVQGDITGDANIVGENIAIAGGNWLSIGDLNDANAIRADHDIIITVAPGGTLDMSKNPGGTTVINAANDVTIYADNILLDDGNGVLLEDIVSAGGSINTYGGRRFTNIQGDPNYVIYTYKAYEGQSEFLTVQLPIRNCGNMSETIDYQVQTEGKTGWASPSSTSGYVTLDPMDSNSIGINVNIPSYALPAENVTITMTLKRQGYSEVEDTTSATVMVCPYVGDFDHDGAVDCNDLADFALPWLTDSNSESWRGNFDLSDSNDGLINFDDFGRMTQHWMFGK